MSPELRLIIAPRATYSDMVRQAVSVGPLSALRRPLLAALVLGIAMALASTGQVTPSIVLSMIALWSVVVIAQVVIAVTVIGNGAPGVGRARALDLFFTSHAPWSLWWLFAAVSGKALMEGPFKPLLVVALLPLALTVRSVAAFFREVLGMSPRRAGVRTLVHQTLTWGLLLTAYGAAVAIWPRILQALR